MAIQNLNAGSKGPEVLNVQKRLASLGIYSDAIDGEYGPATQSAVAAFQDKEQLNADGIVGKETWTRLEQRAAELNELNQGPVLARKLEAEGVSDEKTEAEKPQTGPEASGQQLAGFKADDLNRADQLGIRHETLSLCRIILARDVQPPLSIGLFGDWGVGKSFFIKEMDKRVREFTAAAALAEAKRGTENYMTEPAFWSDVAQIHFNAWHFMDANLWASLVSRIFDGLADHIQERDQDDVPLEAQQDELYREIELAHEAVREFEAEKQKAVATRDAAETELQAIKADIADAQNQLAQFNPLRAAAIAWEQFRKTDKDLETALDELGYTQALENVDEVKRAVETLQTDWGKIQAKLSSLFNDGSRSARAMLILIIIAAGMIVAEYVKSGVADELVKTIVGNISQLATWIVGIAGSMKVLLKKVNSRLETVKSAAKRLAMEDSVQTQLLNRQCQETERQIEDLRDAEEKTIEQIEQKQAQIALLEEKLADLKVGRRLFKFIEERVSSSEYKDQLGIIAMVRRDFERLTDLLVEQSLEKRKAWRRPAEPGTRDNDGKDGPITQKQVADADGNTSRKAGRLALIDRIILYIDDLDRCPPERVVEVMQAVHLLLAFKLFVVVVAVDSRWLLRSLEKGYPDFLVLDRQIEGSGAKSLARWASTPQSYLEKIFQIPFHIKRMDAAGFRALLNEFASPVEETPGLPDAKTPSLSLTDRIDGDDHRSRDSRNNSDQDKHENTDENDIAAGPKVNLYPPNLKIRRVEVEFMVSLFGMIGTPRGVNRFVNTYRLLRASIPAGERNDFTNAQSGEYRHAAVLLALLVGFAHESAQIFLALSEQSDRKTWRRFVEGIKPKRSIKRATSKSGDRDSDKKKKPDPATKEILYRNDFVSNISAINEPRWTHIYQTLNGIETLSNERLKPFRKWVLRITRYAFYPINTRGQYRQR